LSTHRSVPRPAFPEHLIPFLGGSLYLAGRCILQEIAQAAAIA
jgi:hypothetical protein